MYVLDVAERAICLAERHSAAARRRERLELQRRGAQLTVLRRTMAARRGEESHAEYLKRKEFQLAAKPWMTMAEVALRITALRVRCLMCCEL